MLFRVVLFIIGFLAAVAGGISLIGYLNLIAMGNSWMDYIHFIAKRPESYLLPLGIFIITYGLFRSPEKWNDSFPKE